MLQLTRVRGRGFAIVELGTVLTLGLIVFGVLATSMAGSRGMARSSVCKQNLRLQAEASAAYAADNQGLIATYSWRGWEVYDDPSPALRGPFSSDSRAIMAQNTALLRRLTGRGLGQPDRILLNWLTLPIKRYNHLILLDYLGLPAPQLFAACPEDRNLMLSKADPFDESLWAEQGNYNNYSGFSAFHVRMRYPYSSSYQMVPYAWFADGTYDSGEPFVSPITWNSHVYRTPSAVQTNGRRNLSEVVFPGKKVFLFEHNDFHHDPGNPFYAYEQARSMQLFFDGSVRAMRSSDAQPGWDPRRRESGQTAYYAYTPLSTEPIPIGAPWRLLPVRYRFTRDGLAGFDYGNFQLQGGR